MQHPVCGELSSEDGTRRPSDMACLDREHIIARVLLASHEQPKLLHAFSSKSGLVFSLGNLSSTCAITILLKEFFLATLSLPFKPFDDIDGATKVTIRLGLLLCGLAALHGSEQSRMPRKRFGQRRVRPPG